MSKSSEVRRPAVTGVLAALVAVVIASTLSFATVSYAAPPTVTSVTPPPAARYVAGRHLDFTVTFDQMVTVTGTPRLVVTLDQGGVRYANYRSGSGTNQLRFRLTVTAGIADSDGVQLGANLDLNSGTIRNGANEDVAVLLNNVGTLANVRVGGLLAYEPFLRNSTNTSVRLINRDTDGSTGFASPWVLIPATGSSSRLAEDVTLNNSSANMAFPTNVSFALPANDGKVMTSNTTAQWWPSNVGRALNHPISLDEAGVTYITFLFRDATVDGQALMGFLTGIPSSRNDTSPTAITFGFGYGNRIVADIDSANLMAFINGYTAQTATTFSGVSTVDNKSWFMVAEITTVPTGSDRIRIKAFRASETVPSDPTTITWDVTRTQALTGTLTHASVQLESVGSSELDEMRIASSYGDVVGLTPGPPRNLSTTYTSGATTASVNADPPLMTGGSAITGYFVSATPTSGGLPISVFSPTLPASVTGLNPAITYSFGVAAANIFGIGPAVGVDPGVSAATASPPGTPNMVSAVAGDASAEVTVSASAGGAPDSFIVTSSPGGRTCTIVSPATSCVVTGLTNGTSYTFTAVATNTGGTSTPSAASSAVTPQATGATSTSSAPTSSAPTSSAPTSQPATSPSSADRQSSDTTTASELTSADNRVRQLPNTGSSTMTLAMTALLLVGAAVMILGLRRRVASTGH